MKNSLLKYYIAAFYLCSTIITYAQDPGSNDTGGGLESADPAAPIDGYVYILAAVGFLFVFLKFRAILNTKTKG